LVVWKDATVSDATLVGCIQEIRKALNDDSKSPRYVRTVPRRGYQFIAPVASAAAETEVIEPHVPPQRRPRIWPYVLAAVASVAGVIVFANLRQRTPVDRSLSEVAWFKLDGGEAADAGGNLPALRISGPAKFVAGALGGAVRLDGVSAALDGDDPRGRLPSGDSPRTVTAWIRTTSTNGDSSVIVNFNSNGGSEFSPDNFSLMLLKSGHVAWSRHGRADVYLRREVAVSKSRVDDGEWHFIAGRFEGAPSNSASVFVDGVESDPAIMPLVSPFMPGPGRFAAGNGVVRGTSFRGDIDDVRVFERALNQAGIAAIHRCVSGVNDLQDGFYFIAANSPSPEGPVHLRIDSEIQHTGTSFAGVHLVRRTADCGLRSIRAADAGQDLYFAMDVLAPTNEDHMETQAGPYFRSRRAAPGDGIIGGTSAGFWVRLHSTGAVSVRRLNPSAIIAFAAPTGIFNASAFHHLEVSASGAVLQVALDRRLVVFDQGGAMTSNVVLDRAWEELPVPGTNAGTVGVYFGAEGNNARIGGQRAKNLRLEKYRPLFQ